jgi:hypothetical protein
MTKKPLAAPPKPYKTARGVGSFVPQLTRKAFEKYGFAAATLITDWPAIVGKDLARYTAPERLKWPKAPDARAPDVAPEAKGRPGATLFLRVDGPQALDVEYKRAQIAERINAYFGYRAVVDVRIVQAPLDKKPAPRASRITPADKVELPAVSDERLRAALEKLGAGLKARKRRDRQAG